MDVKNKIKEYLPYLGVVTVIILPWFFQSGYLFFIDFVWGPNINLNWTNSWFLTNFLVKIFSFVFNVDFLEKIFIGAVVLVVLLGGRKIAGYFVKDKFVIFVLSLFAFFNPFVYDRVMYGQMGVVLALGFFFFAISYLLEYLEKREGKQMIYFGIFSGLAIQFSIHFIFFFGIILLLFLFLYFKKWKFDNWKNFIKFIFLAGFICILLNINWIVGDLLNKTNKLNFVDSGITKQDLLAFKTSGSSNFQVLSNVSLMSGFWGKDQHKYADLSTIKKNWGRSFLLLFPIILFGLFIGIRKAETRFLSIGLFIIFLISIVLASGIAFSYFQNLTYWMFEHIPFYKGLRETQKWVSVIVLFYAIFLSIGVKALFDKKIVLIHKNTILVFLGLVIVMQAPFLLWGFYGQARSTPYPNDWQMLNKEIKCEKEEKILFLPWHLYMGFSWTGKTILNPSEVFFTCPVISSSAMEWGGIYDNSGNSESIKIYEWLKKQGVNNLLKDDILGIKYIILAKELDWKNYFWIEKIDNLKLKTETATLKVYEVNSYPQFK